MGLMSDKDKLDSAISGGSVAIITELDPYVTKTDTLVGQIAGIKGTLPEPSNELNFQLKLFDKITTSSGDIDVKPIVPGEPLMLIVNSMTTVGVTSKINPKECEVKLKRPVMAFKEDRVVIFRRFEGNKWRISGYGIINK
jgi:translation initiation factor 2 subunit 3